MGHSRPLFRLLFFSLFNQMLQFLPQINVKKCPSSIRRWDSNSWPFTSRPGLPPNNVLGDVSIGVKPVAKRSTNQLSKRVWGIIEIVVYTHIYYLYDLDIQLVMFWRSWYQIIWSNQVGLRWSSHHKKKQFETSELWTKWFNSFNRTR